MTLSQRRRVAFVLLVVLVLVAAPAIWIGSKWNRAIANVNKMIVMPVALPTETPGPSPTAEQAERAEVAVPAAPSPTPIPEPEGAQNILLVGTDGRPGEEDNGIRTDTIVWMHFDPSSGRVSMLSFPRDLWVNIPGYGKNRINAAYSIGERKIGPGYGPALLKKTVGDFLGVPVDHFVMINFQGFKTVIDTIGGIYVDVPKAIDDPAYPTDDYRTIKVHFDAGRQLLDGDRALIYARTRHADSDFGRNQRQQQVLMAIFERVREQGLLSQLTNFDQYTDALSDYIRTDISRSQMLSLASAGRHLRPENIQRFAIDSTMVVARTQPAYVLELTDKKGLKRMVSQIIDPSVAAAGGEQPRSEK